MSEEKKTDEIAKPATIADLKEEDKTLTDADAKKLKGGSAYKIDGVALKTDGVALKTDGVA